jgi:hypothetical protein
LPDGNPQRIAILSIGIPYRAASIASFFVASDRIILVPFSGFARSLGFSTFTFAMPVTLPRKVNLVNAFDFSSL